MSENTPRVGSTFRRTRSKNSKNDTLKVQTKFSDIPYNHVLEGAFFVVFLMFFWNIYFPLALYAVLWIGLLRIQGDWQKILRKESGVVEGFCIVAFFVVTAFSFAFLGFLVTLFLAVITIMMRNYLSSRGYRLLTLENLSKDPKIAA